MQYKNEKFYKYILYKMVLIGICGKMGSGKDYIATKYILPYLRYVKGKTPIQLSFADQIKVNVMTKNNLSFNEMYVKKSDYTRQLLQMEGTESGRNILGNDIWIKYFNTWSQIFMSRGIDTIITSDVRFRNEMEYIKKQNGIIIKISAPDRNEKRLQQESGGDIKVYNRIKNHQSECDLDNVDNSNFDYIIDNDINNKVDFIKLYKFLDTRIKDSEQI